jgi:hypothetical protein
VATLAPAAKAARERLLYQLSKPIRDYIEAVNEMGAAVEARDLGRVQRAWLVVQGCEAAYLEQWA